MLSVLNKGRVPVKLWAPLHEVESGALDQLTNLSTLPFVFKHIPVMPDCHVGKGATVGTVLPTENALIPAAIGVDIGCFTGDTMIPLLNGEIHDIKSLVGKEFTVYSCTPSGKVVAAKATAKLTRTNAELVAVTLDNGWIVKCTPDHLFMLRDGNYCKAEDLKIDTSLMPLYRGTDRDGYTYVEQPYSGRMQRAHWMVGRQAGAIIEEAAQVKDLDADVSLLLSALRYCIRHEMVVKASDFLVRRKGLLYFNLHRLMKFKEPVLLEMATQFKWSAERIVAERNEMDDLIKQTLQFKS
jgi:hypothetical protein